jgi:MFS family permease
MSSGSIQTEKKRGWKPSLSAFTLIVSTFTWYTLIGTLFPQVVADLHLLGYESFSILAVFYSATIFSAFAGATLLHSRSNVLKVWIIIGTFSSLLLFFVDISLPLSAFIVALFLGLSIGMGLPSCLAYFADSTKIENRGVQGGISWSGVSVTFLLIAIALGTVDYVQSIVLIAAVRGIGLVIFALPEKKTEKILKPPHEIPSYKTLLSGRTLILYFISWFMFCLVNWMETPVIENIFGYENFVLFGLVEVAVSGVSAPISGYFSDKIGRRRIMIIGFVILGIGYAILGLFPASLYIHYLYMVLDGCAWGIFASVFFMVLWGDLANEAQKERFYLIGGLPYLIAQFLSILSEQYISSIQENAAFSLASFFLFLAVLPLLYAPETLPEKKIKERELKDYVEKARKVKEKYT